MRAAIALVTLAAAFAAGESTSSRTTQETNISTYPYVAALLRASSGTNYQHSCAGSILNNRSVLTAARCLYEDAPTQWRFRVGSSQHNSGGTVYSVKRIAVDDFDEWAMLNDIAVIRTDTNIVYGENVRAGSFAGANYVVTDNQAVVTAGWGRTNMPMWNPAQYAILRRHEQTTINIETCRPPYSSLGFFLRDFSQICSGFRNPGSVSPADATDKCLGEPGAPLIHSGTIVGVRSYALGCNAVDVPTISTRVGNYISWIASEA